jgi:TRAP-type C4-dicarboxylate transport system permease small subunit
MQNFQKVLDKISIGGEIFTRFILFALMILICSDVVGRYAFGKPLDAAIELGEFAMIIIVYCCIAHCQRLKLHVKVELFTSHLSPKTQTYLCVITDSIGVGLWSLIAWQGLDAAIRAYKYSDTTEGLVPLPLFPPKLLVSIGAALLALQLIFSISDEIKKLRSGDFAHEHVR